MFSVNRNLVVGSWPVIVKADKDSAAIDSRFEVDLENIGLKDSSISCVGFSLEKKIQ